MGGDTEKCKFTSHWKITFCKGTKFIYIYIFFFLRHFKPVFINRWEMQQGSCSAWTIIVFIMWWWGCASGQISHVMSGCINLLVPHKSHQEVIFLTSPRLIVCLIAILGRRATGMAGDTKVEQSLMLFCSAFSFWITAEVEWPLSSSSFIFLIPFCYWLLGTVQLLKWLSNSPAQHRNWAQPPQIGDRSSSCVTQL